MGIPEAISDFLQQGRERLLSNDGSFEITLVSLMFLGLGIAIGFRVGEDLGKKCKSRKDFWICVAVIMALAVLVSAFIAHLWLFIIATAYGLVAGALAGLKFGFQETLSPWKFKGPKNKSANAANSDSKKASKSGTSR